MVDVSVDESLALGTALYRPDAVGSFPTVLIRTPYGKEFWRNDGIFWASHGYRLVLQDCRGTSSYFDEADDGEAAVKWIQGQDRFDGRLGLQGMGCRRSRRLRRSGVPHRLVMGPWMHGGGWAEGNVEALRWFDTHVQNRDDADRPTVSFYVTGSDEWKEVAGWANSDSRSERWYLAAPDGLASTPSDRSLPSRYTYDPTDPTPSVGFDQLRPRTRSAVRQQSTRGAVRRGVLHQ